MQLVRRIEVNYLRSLYRAVVDRPGDINVVFGRNDSGKSNVLRALNLFFNGEIEPGRELDFELDFTDIRKTQARSAKGKQFISVRIDFNVPKNYQKSLGDIVSIKKQWNIYGGSNEFIPNMSTGSKVQLRKFLNQIDFTYIPAIKSLDVFGDLIQRMYAAAAQAKGLQTATDEFVDAIRVQTNDLSEGLSRLFNSTTRLAAPTDMGQLFRSLDFSHGEDGHSLLRQKGDGVKARHLPELLRYINENESGKRYFVWGFEEPENSLDLGAADAEAKNFAEISSRSDTQIFITSHSPAFYLAGIETKKAEIRKLFVSKQSEVGGSEAVLPKNAISIIDKLDDAESMMHGASLMQLPYLIRRWSEMQEEHDVLTAEKEKLSAQLHTLKMPTLFVEGKLDKELFGQAFIRLGVKSTDLSIKVLDGTPKSAAELLPKINASGGISGGSKILFLFDNDKAGRAAYRNLVGDKKPGKDPARISLDMSVWALPVSAEVSDFIKKYSIPPEILFYTSEFMFDGAKAAELCRVLMTPEAVNSSQGIIHGDYHGGLGQIAAQALREAGPGTSAWFWSRGVPVNLKDQFAERAAQELDLSQVDAVAQRVVAELA